MWQTIKTYVSALTWQIKAVFLVSLLGVLMAAGYTVKSRYFQHKADQSEVLANQYKEDAAVAKAEALQFKAAAEKVKDDLAKANTKLAKLHKIVDGIKVPPKPGPAPAGKKQLVSDLQGMGLELVTKPSVMIAPCFVGVTENDAKTVWGWGKENLRIPALEQKIDAQTNLIAGLDKAKTLAETLADTRTKQADSFQKAADSKSKEADSLRVVVDDTKKALAVEKKKRYLYMAGAAVLTYAVAKH